jgi:glutamate--cysteine ligase
MRFLDAFLLRCLLAESPNDRPVEIAEIAEREREPGLRLRHDGREIGLAA